MIVKFLNGHLADIPLNQEIIFCDENHISIYNYITENSENIGIDIDHLMFYEQIEFVLYNENQQERSGDISIILCVFIRTLETFEFEDVESWIDCLDCLDKKEKLEKYMQYLADRSMIVLSATSRYYEIWYNTSNEGPEEERDIGRKISSIWPRHTSLENTFSSVKQDDGSYLCINIPVSTISNDVYYITILFKEQDLD